MEKFSSNVIMDGWWAEVGEYISGFILFEGCGEEHAN